MNRKELAIKLRTEGYSYSYIREKTGYALSTLSFHLSQIPYEPNKQTQAKMRRAQVMSVLKKTERTRFLIMSARKQARVDIGKLTRRDLFMLGIGLYIGEGSKTQGHVRLVNADIRVIRLYLSWLRSLGLTSKNFVVRLHLYPESSYMSAQNYWSKGLGLGLEQFQKPFIDRRGNKDRKRSKIHVNGTAHVTVRSNGKKAFGVELSRRIGAWIEEVLE